MNAEVTARDWIILPFKLCAIGIVMMIVIPPTAIKEWPRCAFVVALAIGVLVGRGVK